MATPSLVCNKLGGTCNECGNNRWPGCDILEQIAKTPPGERPVCSNCATFGGEKCKCSTNTSSFNDMLWRQAHSAPDKKLPLPKDRTNLQPMPRDRLPSNWQVSQPPPSRVAPDLPAILHKPNGYRALAHPKPKAVSGGTQRWRQKVGLQPSDQSTSYGSSNDQQSWHGSSTYTQPSSSSSSYQQSFGNGQDTPFSGLTGMAVAPGVFGGDIHPVSMTTTYSNGYKVTVEKPSNQSSHALPSRSNFDPDRRPPAAKRQKFSPSAPVFEPQQNRPSRQQSPPYRRTALRNELAKQAANYEPRGPRQAASPVHTRQNTRDDLDKRRASWQPRPSRKRAPLVQSPQQEHGELDEREKEPEAFSPNTHAAEADDIRGRKRGRSHTPRERSQSVDFRLGPYGAHLDDKESRPPIAEYVSEEEEE